jgi:hypothetical protein
VISFSLASIRFHLVQIWVLETSSLEEPSYFFLPLHKLVTSMVFGLFLNINNDRRGAPVHEQSVLKWTKRKAYKGSTQLVYQKLGLFFYS